MKKYFLVIVITVIIVSLVNLFTFSIYQRYYDIELLSSVKAPVKFALQSIHNDLVTGKMSEAQKKMEILIDRWEPFANNLGIYESLGNIMIEFNSITE